MSIYRRKDSPYYWFWIEGTKVRASTGIPVRGASKEQDKELHRQALELYTVRKAAAVQEGAGLAVRRPVISFATFAEWYDTHHAAHHRGAEREQSMVRQLRGYFDRFDSLALITADVVKEWMTWRKHTVCPNTVNRELDVLKAMLKAATPKYLPAHPIAGLRRFRVEEQDVRVLTHDEEQRLLEAAGPEDKAWLILAIDTLLRLSNVVFLKWAQVKAHDIVPLNAKVKHDGVPITTRLRTALAALTAAGDWVFPSFHASPKRTAAKNAAIRRFHDLCQLAVVPHGRKAGGVTFHCLRHTGATRALQRGASVRTVMKLGGWKDETSVMRYVHAADSDVRAAAESISHKTPIPFTPRSRGAKTR